MLLDAVFDWLAEVTVALVLLDTLVLMLDAIVDRLLLDGEIE